MLQSKTLQEALSFQEQGLLFQTRMRIHWKIFQVLLFKVMYREAAPALRHLNFRSHSLIWFCFFFPQGIRQKLDIKGLFKSACRQLLPMKFLA